MKLLPEWLPQRAILLTWPHPHSDWRDNLEPAEQEIIQLAKTILDFEDLLIVCDDEDHQQHVLDCLQPSPGKHPSEYNVETVIAPSNDCWARDHGPLSMRDSFGLLHYYDFGFNGWGNKYPSEKDNTINEKLSVHSSLGSRDWHHHHDFILEGGSIEINESGELLTTRSCLLNKNRNHLSQAELEKQLCQYLGCTQIHWLEHGHLEGDDTDGHIDTLARFTSDSTIAYVSCDDPQDSHYAAFQRMETELKALRNTQGVPYRCVPLPWPERLYTEDGSPLPATYANFLIINGAVLVPNYNSPKDAMAEATLAELFPDRNIIGVPSCEIIKQSGSIHCLTMQIY